MQAGWLPKMTRNEAELDAYAKRLLVIGNDDRWVGRRVETVNETKREGEE